MRFVLGSLLAASLAGLVVLAGINIAGILIDLFERLRVF